MLYSFYLYDIFSFSNHTKYSYKININYLKSNHTYEFILPEYLEVDFEKLEILDVYTTIPYGTKITIKLGNTSQFHVVKFIHIRDRIKTENHLEYNANTSDVRLVDDTFLIDIPFFMLSNELELFITYNSTSTDTIKLEPYILKNERFFSSNIAPDEKVIPSNNTTTHGIIPTINSNNEFNVYDVYQPSLPSIKRPNYKLILPFIPDSVIAYYPNQFLLKHDHNWHLLRLSHTDYSIKKLRDGNNAFFNTNYYADDNLYISDNDSLFIYKVFKDIDSLFISNTVPFKNQATTIWHKLINSLFVYDQKNRSLKLFDYKQNIYKDLFWFTSIYSFMNPMDRYLFASYELNTKKIYYLNLFDEYIYPYNLPEAIQKKYSNFQIKNNLVIGFTESSTDFWIDPSKSDFHYKHTIDSTFRILSYYNVLDDVSNGLKAYDFHFGLRKKN